MQSSTHMVYPGSQILTFNFMIPPGTDYQLGIDGGNSGLFRNNEMEIQFLIHLI